MNCQGRQNFQPSIDNSLIYKQQKLNGRTNLNTNMNTNTNMNNLYDPFAYLKYNDIPFRAQNLNHIENSSKCIYQMESFELIKLLLKQYDFFLQLLIQNVLLTSDQGLKYRCYSLLFSFYMARERIINHTRLPEHEVYFNFCRIFNENKGIKLRPQISFFQPPILEITPILVKFIMKKTFSKVEVTQILKEFFPFVNPIYLPICPKGVSTYKLKLVKVEDKTENENIVENSATEGNGDNITFNKDNTSNNFKRCNEIFKDDNNSLYGNDNINKNCQDANNYSNDFLKRKRRKFVNIHDHLIMIGLLTHGKKNIEIVQQLWLDTKTPQEVGHRIKNLTCFKAPDNVIKKWKIMNDSLLSKGEFYSFLKGIQWFGIKKKWSAIARYFLPERSSEYLEEFFELLIETKVLNCEEFKINNQHNNCDLDQNKRKKKSKFFLCYKNSDTLDIYKNDFADEIILTQNSLKKSEIKNVFFTAEGNYEEINENIFNKNNFISTRNRNSNHSKSNYSNLNYTRLFSQDRHKSFPFDFHIKNCDDNSFEKIVID